MKKSKSIIGTSLRRMLDIRESTVDADKRTVDIAFSSDKPISRFFGLEILSHDKGAVNMERMKDGAPLLHQHDPTKQIGVVTDASVDDDGVGRATVKLSRNPFAEEIFRDIQDGIVTKVSVGYSIEDSRDEGKKDNISVVRVTKWTPHEVSFVSVAADDSVGVDRSKETEVKTTQTITLATEEVKTVDYEPTNQEKIRMEEKDMKEMNEKAAAEAQKAERVRVGQIEDLAAKFADRVTDMAELRKEAVNEGWSEGRMKGEILERTHSPGEVNTTLARETEIGLSEKEAQEFSFTRLINSQIPNSGVKADFEMECHKAALKNALTNRGFQIPVDVQLAGRRDMTIGTAADGGNLKPTDHMSWVELLRNQLVASALGVREMAGLRGDIQIPTQTGASTGYWLGEADSITESTASIGQITLSPKTFGAAVDFSRLLTLQSVPAVENIVRQDLIAVSARMIDAALFHGTGANDQPRGLQYSSVTSQSFASSWTFSGSVDLERIVMNQNYSSDAFKYVTTPSLWATLKARDRGSDLGVYVNDGSTTNGYPFLKTNNVNSGYVFFGDFSQVMLGMWGNLDMLVNPYIESLKGNIRVQVFQSIDFALRYSEAFSYGYSVA